ncbi:hypothetical protein MKQ68_17790 [Chitinophaga horti]|uniref:Lipoprotein n=1 Tax=Chitinophaga horti TaxID=2920382 RepID=A0ABY6IX29_9BACT|nr:hypothetical protein [Chitinophaga horti]UYQ91940.1 hypothetical protein MKQ68_17790 [Chitinophaga horti]
MKKLVVISLVTLSLLACEKPAQTWEGVILGPYSGSTCIDPLWLLAFERSGRPDTIIALNVPARYMIAGARFPFKLQKAADVDSCLTMGGLHPRAYVIKHTGLVE